MIYLIVFLVLMILAFLWGRKNLYVSTYKGPVTDHFDGKKFFNPPANEMGSFKDLMLHQLKGNRKKWPAFIPRAENQEKVEPKVNGGISYKQINHATILIQTQNVNILTDPVFSKRASPLQFMGPARFRETSLALENIPNIDLIVISHDHYDHLDIKSLQYFSEKHKSKILVGLGLKGYLEKFNITNVEELDWQESFEYKGIKSTFLRCNHWSNRFASPYATLWGSWMLQSESKNIYYAGDTAFDSHFEAIKSQFNRIDLALIPVGAYEPRFFMKYVHMNPSDAFKAHEILDPEKSFAIHWGTFRLTDESLFDPIEELQKIIESKDDNRFEYDRDHNRTFHIE